MSEEADLLREIRDLLLLIAEPQLAARDEEHRTSLSQIIGKSKQKAQAIALMDGTRSQALIAKECQIDMGYLSRLVKALRGENLLGPDDKQPRLVIRVPQNILDV